MASDQKGSLMARVNGFPLHVRVDSDFNEDEFAAIQAAADEWNLQGNRAIGQDIFVLDRKQISDSFRAKDPTNCSQNLGDNRHLALVREDQATRWRALGFSKATPGATMRCFTGKHETQQVIYVNPALIPEQTRRDLQLKNVFAHEFGHAIGLDHSCVDGEGRDDYRGCKGLHADHEYYKAVMYPNLKPIISMTVDAPGVSEESLQDNDKSRGACVIGDSSS